MKKKRENKNKPKDKAISKSEKNYQNEKILIENFTILQKVLVTLSEKVSKLTEQISGLLELFESSAKELAEKEFNTQKENPETSRILQGIRELSEQNKVIAKGLTLMHGQPARINEISQGISEERIPGTTKSSSIELDEYSQNISSKLKKLKPLPQ